MIENIKDSNALGKEVGKVHAALLLLAEEMKVDLIVCSLKDYINDSNLQSL